MIIRRGARIFVSGPVSLENVREVLAEGLAEIENGAIEADFGGVEHVDSTAIGMMLEWMRAAKRRNQRLSFLNMKEDIKSLARLYGLNGMILQE